MLQGAIDPHTRSVKVAARFDRKLDSPISTTGGDPISRMTGAALEAGRALHGVEVWPHQACSSPWATESDHHTAAKIRAPCRGGTLSNFKNELRGCGPFLHKRVPPTAQTISTRQGTGTAARAKGPATLSVAAGHSKEIITGKRLKEGVGSAKTSSLWHLWRGQNKIAQAETCAIGIADPRSRLNRTLQGAKGDNKILVRT